MTNTDNTSSRSAGAEGQTVVVGLQWGDEGKGKIVDLLAAEHDAVVRYNGGANAGHSVVTGGERHSLHLIPSGVLRPGVLAVIGNGVVVDPAALVVEMDMLTKAGVDLAGLRVSDRAHVVTPWHLLEDAARERTLASTGADEQSSQSIGTTLRGIGPAYADKVQRSCAVRMGDLLRPEALRQRLMLATTFHQQDSINVDELAESLLEIGQRLHPHITDTVQLLHDEIRHGRRLLFEGANGTLLDVDHGTYPFVTSSNASALGVGAGSGVPPRCVDRVIGVVKAYCTRVGAGPFPTEQPGEVGERLRRRGHEFGTTTGRPRRTGWLDLVALRYASMINGCAAVAVTLLDVLAGFDKLLFCTSYRIDGVTTDRFIPDAGELARVEPVYESMPGFAAEITEARSRSDLPAEAQAYLKMIEHWAQAPVTLVSVGPDRSQTLID